MFCDYQGGCGVTTRISGLLPLIIRDLTNAVLANCCCRPQDNITSNTVISEIRRSTQTPISYSCRTPRPLLSQANSLRGARITVFFSSTDSVDFYWRLFFDSTVDDGEDNDNNGSFRGPLYMLRYC